jgi:hypothetical protein
MGMVALNPLITLLYNYLLEVPKLLGGKCNCAENLYNFLRAFI